MNSNTWRECADLFLSSDYEYDTWRITNPALVIENILLKI